MDSDTLLRGIQRTQLHIDERVGNRNRMHLKLFVNESTLAERLRFYFIKNQATSLRIRLFKFTIKILTVILYVVRTVMDHSDSTVGCGRLIGSTNLTWSSQYEFSWEPIIWVRRHPYMWYTQVILAFISFIFELINTYAHYKGNLAQQVFSTTWFLEIFCAVPFVVSIFYAPARCLFVPVFLNIWLARSGLEHMINDLHRAAHKQQSAMFNQIFILMSTLICLIVTCVCGVEHLERAGEHHRDLFDSFWFVIVTFSTVGYGSITPTIWPSRLLVIIIICVALGILPSQWLACIYFFLMLKSKIWRFQNANPALFHGLGLLEKLEKLSFTWAESKRHGGEYSRQRATTEKHVVVCATVLRMDVILDFLNEFYAHPTLQRYFVVLLSPGELDGPLKRFLQIPIWAERVIYIQGSVLRDTDLLRVKMDAAEACFILTSRLEIDRAAADEQTILRAMAVKDFAPSCPLYVQILRPESMLHVQFANRVICDEEFKHILLSMNSYIPGISTLITLLAHTSKGREGENLNSVWKMEFGMSAGNEIYSVVASESKFFGEFIGCKFSHASMTAHSKCGAVLFATERCGEIRINPGNEFVIESEDTLFYICVTQEEDAKIVEQSKNDQNAKNNHIVQISVDDEVDNDKKPSYECNSDNAGSRQPSLKREVVTDSFNIDQSPLERSSETCTTMGSTDIGFPPVSPYVGHSTPTMCHILLEKAQACCLRLDRPCHHCRCTSALHYSWPNPPIIVCAEFAAQSLFNVMVPLRAYHRSKASLHPIVLVLEHSPENVFLNAISCFPMVYYMLGGMNKYAKKLKGGFGTYSLDSLLLAGVTCAHTAIVLDRETSMYADEAYMADSRQLVATQTMYRLFPEIPTYLELTHASNMRFMHFEPPEADIDANEFRKEREREKSCSLSYLFREAFASGKVFSCSMLDTLLYQSFIKDYLIPLLRIMLGLQYTAGSGHLDMYKINEKDEGKTYHQLFRLLSKKKGCVVLGIYRLKDDAKPNTLPESFTNDQKRGLTPTMSASSMRSDGDTGLNRGRRSLDENNDSNEYNADIGSKRKKLSISTMKHSLKSKFSGSKRTNLRRLHLLNSFKSDRQKLNEMIQYRMNELDLPQRTYQSPAKTSKCAEKNGYILLNPSPDVVLKNGDILYTISPERNTAESRSSSITGDSVDDSSWSEDFIVNTTVGEDSKHDRSSIREPRLSRIHCITSIDEESDITDDELNSVSCINSDTKL